MTVAGAFDWCFRNRETNEITIAQWPNLSLGVFLVTVVLRQVIDEASTAYEVVSWAGAAALAWWALDEVIRGVNPWRRLLGVGGTIAAIASVVTLLR